MCVDRKGIVLLWQGAGLGPQFSAVRMVIVYIARILGLRDGTNTCQSNEKAPGYRFLNCDIVVCDYNFFTLSFSVM